MSKKKLEEPVASSIFFAMIVRDGINDTINEIVIHIHANCFFHNVVDQVELGTTLEDAIRACLHRK